MAVQTTYPGVYIDEFAPGAPIEGVGTSTPAFIGIAAKGDLDTPTRLTSWQQFRALFGEEPSPGFYLWYAVRGFFENGGQVCYVVRASNGTYDEFGIVDRSGVATSFVPKGKLNLALENSKRAEVVEEKIVQGAEAEVDPTKNATYEKTPSSFDRSVEPPYGPAPMPRPEP